MTTSTSPTADTSRSLERPRGLDARDAGLLLLSVLGALAAAMGLLLLIMVAFPKASSEERAVAAKAGAEGAALYKITCAACHGQEGRGVTGLGKDMTTSPFVKGLDDAGLAAFIKVGRASDDPANTTKVPMPPMGGNPKLTDDQLDAIIKHIRSL